MKYLFVACIVSLGLFSCSTHADGDFASERGSSDPNGGPSQIQAGQITAGEWNDLQNWGYWLDLLTKDEFSGMPAMWNFNLENRVSVKVAYPTGAPAINETVQLRDDTGNVLWESRTDNRGMAELWPRLSDPSFTGDLFIFLNGSSYPATLYANGVNELQIQAGAAPPLDGHIAFIVDATGSMGDELSYLKTELVDVIHRVEDAHPSATVYTGTVFYRDEGDKYVTRRSDFSSSVSQTVDFIEDQKAGGGGDYPEAVHEGLREAVQNLQWGDNSRCRIAFLLLDAPPHEDQQVIQQINNLVAEASQKGVQIIPVLASGGNKSTEFLMRYLSIATNGTYTFVTNDSGIGNDHIEASVGEYEVEYLNDLMVRLINARMD